MHSLKNRVVEAQLSFVHVDSLSKKAGIMAKVMSCPVSLGFPRFLMPLVRYLAFRLAALVKTL